MQILAVVSVVSILCAGLFPRAADAKMVAQWTFENESVADTVSGLTALPLNSSVVQLKDGVLRLDNQGKPDQDGAALIIPDSPLLTGHADGGTGYTSLVLEVDVKPTAIGDQMQIIRKTEGEFGYQLYMLKDGVVGFRIKTDQGSFTGTSKNKIPADGQWHHIEAVWDSSVWSYNIHLAVDGVMAWKSTEIKNLSDTKAPLTIGGLYRAADNIGQRFSGEIDNVRISVDCPELMKVRGQPLADPAEMTGLNLTNQPGFLGMQFIYDPPVTPECHAGTLAQRPDGKLVAAWFGGTHEGHIDAGIWESVLNGQVWSLPEKVAHGTYRDGSPSSTFNPVLYQYPNGPMLLFYLSGELNLGNMKTSYDGGRSWSETVYLPGTIRGASKNKPVLLSDGTLVCPDNSSRLKFDRTRDFGKTWLESAFTPHGEIDAIQPTILTHRDGRLQALARSKTGSIVTSWSNDGGAIWSPLEKTGLPNNYSGIDAVTLVDGR
ncbi:MAG: exo-alpha-sialidase, partial [Kiritimatiellales bacterium]